MNDPASRRAHSGPKRGAREAGEGAGRAQQPPAPSSRAVARHAGSESTHPKRRPGRPKPSGDRETRPNSEQRARPAREKRDSPGKPGGRRTPTTGARKQAAPSADGPPTEGIRIQKLLAEAGVASRRAAEELIRQGRVLVNGRPVELGARADPARDRITVDGERVQIDPGKVYLMLNKPEGVVTTSKDPEGRRTVLDLIGEHSRVFPVGRLDIATEGLMLLTNDGDLAYRLTHPSFEVAKIYVAEVAGNIGRGVIRQLTETGVDLGGEEPFRVDAVKILGSQKAQGTRTVLELTLHEGPKHVVRRVLDAVDRPVIRLVRTGLGPLRLNRLSSGTYRKLSREEVAALYREVGL